MASAAANLEAHFSSLLHHRSTQLRAAVVSNFLFRIFDSSQILKDQIALHFTHLLSPSRSLYGGGEEEKKEMVKANNGEGEPSGAVFNALDAMLKGSLDRLKTMRETIASVHSLRTGAIFWKSLSCDATVLRALCLEGKSGSALCLWIKLVQQFRKPDLLTHNHLINALCLSGKLDLANHLMINMASQGPFPSCATYNTLMKGYLLIDDVDMAFDLLTIMVNHGIQPNRVSCIILVCALCQKGLSDQSKNFLEKLLDNHIDGKRSNLITSTVRMDGYFKMGNMVKGLSCWNSVLERGIELDVIAYNVIIHGLCLRGNMNHVYKSLCEMLKRGFLPDIFTYNTLISKLCKTGCMDEACYVFNVMSRMDVQPDEVTYKNIIQGLCRNGDAVKANMFLSDMLRTSSIPKRVIWNNLIDAYGKSGDSKKAFFVKDQMSEFGILPNVYTYNALIYTRIREGAIEKAHYLMIEMLSNGVSPDLVTYNLLIGAFCDLGLISSALKLRKEMIGRGFVPDIITYTELIKCYCIRGEVEKAEELFSELFLDQSSLLIDHVPFLLLMKKYFKMGEFNKVFDLYQTWSEGNTKMITVKNQVFAFTIVSKRRVHVEARVPLCLSAIYGKIETKQHTCQCCYCGFLGHNIVSCKVRKEDDKLEAEEEAVAAEKGDVE